MRICSVVVLLSIASAVGAQQSEYNRVLNKRNNRIREYYRRQDRINADVARKWEAGGYSSRADAQRDVDRQAAQLKRWHDQSLNEYNRDLAAWNGKLQRYSANGVYVDVSNVIDDPFAGQRAPGPDLTTADPQTLGRLLEDRDEVRVKAALDAARSRKLKLSPDDLALLIMRSRDSQIVAEAARQLLVVDPSGGPPVLARHVMRNRPGSEELRSLLGESLERRVERARQVEPKRANLIEQVQNVRASNETSLAALDRLANVPGGDVAVLLRRLASDRSEVVASRAQAALARRAGQ